MKELRKCLRVECGRRVNNRQARYCSLKCQHQYQYEQYIARWLAGEVDGSRAFEMLSHHVRRYIMETNGFKCSVCGWGERNPYTGRIPLHVDHIDGNGKNNRPENLRLLCPNDHALTATFGNANKGNGRPGRRARYLRGVKFSPLILPRAHVYLRKAA